MKKLVPFLILAACVPPTDDDLSAYESELSVTSWSDDEQIPNQQSAYAPALVWWDGLLHMVHNGSSDPSQLWTSDFNGSSWSTNVKIRDGVTGRPALTVMPDGTLVMVYQANGLVIERRASRSSGRVRATLALPDLAVGSKPSVAAHAGTLYVAYCDDEKVALDEVIGRIATRVWTRTVPNGGTCYGTSLASFNSELHLVWTERFETDYAGVIRTTHPMKELVMGRTTRTVQALPMNSAQPVSMTVCDGWVHLMHGGDWNSQELWWTYRAASGTSSWATNERVQGSHDGAGIGCRAGTPIMVHPGVTTNHLWYSTFEE